MERAPRLVLGAYPTKVERLSEALWVKRDDLSSDLYGGNKVRKLEILLAAARDAGRRRILTVGAAGSHQVVATALYGTRHGFDVEAVLVPQPRSEHALRNLRVALAQGLRATAAPAWSLAPALVAARWRPGTFFVPLGGSNPAGTLGFVDAAHEVAAQIGAGALEDPDEVVVATGSGGTVAGLALGFEQAGLRTRVIGVAVSPPTWLLARIARRLIFGTAALAGVSSSVASRASKRVDVDGRWLGRGYGHPTRAGDDATARARAWGLVLDPTYTAKAFACALARASAGKKVLYWHTLSTASLAPLDRDEPIPARLARLLSK